MVQYSFIPAPVMMMWTGFLLSIHPFIRSTHCCGEVSGTFSMPGKLVHGKKLLNEN